MKLFFLLGVFIAVGSALNDIAIVNNTLYVNCQEFYIKGMCYNPVPLGISTEGGYCSEKQTAFGDSKSACFDSDYFDGFVDLYRVPPGPADGWFAALWKRDFPVLQELGVNTLRLYNANPTTLQASIDQLGKYDISMPLGRDHIPFMDMASKFGFKVIFPLMGDYTILTTVTRETMLRFLRNQIDEVGNHSALLMWNFSNELSVQDPHIVEMLNDYIAYIRNYTLAKWNRFVPITVAVMDNPHMYDTVVATLDVDVFSSNAGYRGLDFQDLWSGKSTPGFSGFKNLSRAYGKPLFISEIGWHSQDNAIDVGIPNWFNQLYKDLVNHTDDGCIGGAFFEWSDEKYSKSDVMQQTMGVVSYEVAINGEQNSTQENVWLPDLLVRKPIRFESVKSGVFQGKPWNFNADVYSLLGRAQKVLDADVCSSIATEIHSSTVSSSEPTSTVSSSESSTNPTSTQSQTSTSNSETQSSVSVSATQPASSTTSDGSNIIPISYESETTKTVISTTAIIIISVVLFVVVVLAVVIGVQFKNIRAAIRSTRS